MRLRDERIAQLVAHPDVRLVPADLRALAAEVAERRQADAEMEQICPSCKTPKVATPLCPFCERPPLPPRSEGVGIQDGVE